MNTLTKQDEDHLKLLSIFHYVLAGITALFSCLPFIHLIMGIIFLAAPPDENATDAAMQKTFGWMFILIPAVLIVCGWTLAGFIAMAGRYIAQRRRRMFCLVVGAIECIIMPVGTILGVFTIILLIKEPVMAAFGDPIDSAAP